MTNRTSTRRALLSSVMALLLCCTMLIGTTFAWFTDTASTNVNTIQAGTLDVALEVKEGNNWVSAEGKTLNFVKAAGAAEGEAILWEPGCKYSLPQLRIRNNGNLALKYKVIITGIQGDAKLNEAIEWAIDGVAMGTEQKLAVGANNEFTISGHMKESAGNAYQGLTIDGISITVYATQDTVESDSNGNQYDKDAALPTIVETQEEINEKLAAQDATTVNLWLPADTYTLPVVTNKIVTITGTKDTIIDMSNSGIIGAQNANLDIIFDGVTVKFSNTVDYKGITHSKKVTYNNCTLIGKQFLYAEDVEFVNCTFINNDDYAVWTYGAGNATFEGCTFISGGKAILIYTEDANHTNNVVVNNCVFYDNGNLDTAKAAIEIGDSQPTAGLHVNLTVTNNKIYGFANNNEGTPTGNKMWGNKNSIPADRLNVTASDNTEYDATVAITDDAAIVAKALKANTETIEIILTGDVAMDINQLGNITAGSGQYKLGGADTTEINIDLNGHKLTLNTNYWSALGANNNNAAITIKNGSMNSSQTSGTWNSYDLTFYDCKWNFENVTFDKAVAVATNTDTSMKNVTINEKNDVYGLWITADAKSVALDNVTINCPNGRAIAIKDEYVNETDRTAVRLDIKNSKIVSAKKAAILVTNTAGANITANHVDISAVVADSTNLVWIDKDISSVPVTVSGCTYIIEP